MRKPLRWHEYVTLNFYWLGISSVSGIIAPLLLPYLVALFMPPELKNTYYATIRVVTLAVAMFAQPLAGLLSDRNTSRFGRRRPFIFWGAIANALFLMLIALTPQFRNASTDTFFLSVLGVPTAYFALIVAVSFQQAAGNFAHGATQGLLPDVVPDQQRGRAAGVKGIFELLPSFFAILVGPLVDAGRIAETAAIVAAVVLVSMLVTVLSTHEVPITQKPSENVRENVLRFLGLTLLFVAVTQLAQYGVIQSNKLAGAAIASLPLRIALVGFIGLAAMALTIFVGVYSGARLGIGKEASQHRSFIWWVVNRLLFLASIFSIQGFALYYLRDTLHLPNAATATTILLAVVAIFLVVMSLVGGFLSDRFGRKRLVALAGVIAGAGAVLLLFAQNFTMVIVCGCIIGIGVGLFWGSSWALGTDLIPPDQAGRYLGISNLAGAGAGIVGAGIGGPLADAFNAISPGLGYLVIFAIYAGLLLISSLVIWRVEVPAVGAAALDSALNS